MHKNDPGAFSVTLFDELHRKVSDQPEAVDTHTKAECIGKMWLADDPARSYTIHRCINNSDVKANDKWRP